MPTRVLAPVVSLVGVWPLIAAGQLHDQREPHAPQAPTPTGDQSKQAREALQVEGWHPGAVDGVVGRRTR
jgi:hypothetical protein